MQFKFNEKTQIKFSFAQKCSHCMQKHNPNIPWFQNLLKSTKKGRILHENSIKILHRAKIS